MIVDLLDVVTLGYIAWPVGSHVISMLEAVEAGISAILKIIYRNKATK